MNVKELISILEELNPEKEVAIFWDGATRGDVDGIVNKSDEVWLIGDLCIYKETFTKNEIVYEAPEIDDED